MVDVSVSALQTVRRALSDFQSDISGLAQRAGRDAHEIIDSCEQAIDQTEVKIAQLEAIIDELTRQIEALEDTIAQATNAYNYLEAKIPQLEGQIRSLDSTISSLYGQISSLRGQLANTEDSDQKRQIQSMIDSLTCQVHQCEAQRNSLENELHSAERQKEELRLTINRAKAQKADCEHERAVQKNRCNKYKDKLERLKSAFGRVKAETNGYLSAARKFESSSTDRAQSNANATDRCIATIETYLATSL